MKLPVQKITRENFAPFGDLIATDGADFHEINDGNCTRFHDLAKVNIDLEEGRPLLNIFRAKPRAFPLTIEMMERHPIGSQCFVPLNDQTYLVVVCSRDSEPSSENLQAFHVEGNQGVNYAPGTWHFPLIAPTGGDFLVVDRGGPGENCDIFRFDGDLPFLDISLNGA